MAVAVVVVVSEAALRAVTAVSVDAAEAETEGACSGASACAMLLAAAVGACWQGGSF